MRSQQPLRWLSMMALLLAGAGCCCVQGMPGNCGSCGMGRLAACKSCSGGCGEVYIDEWVSQPPCVDQCCAGDCRPVRSLLAALWGSRFVQGCDMCGGGGCDGGCAGTCGYASAGGSGCTTCGGAIGMPAASGGCNCGGGAMVTEPMESVQPMEVIEQAPTPAPSQAPTPAPSVRYAPQHSQRYANTQGYGTEPRIVPGSYKVSPSRRVSGGMASQHINPAMQKIDAKRASYAH